MKKFDCVRDEFILNVKEAVGRKKWIEICQIESDDFGMGFILRFVNSRSGKIIRPYDM